MRTATEREAIEIRARGASALIIPQASGLASGSTGELSGALLGLEFLLTPIGTAGGS